MDAHHRGPRRRPRARASATTARRPTPTSSTGATTHVPLIVRTPWGLTRPRAGAGLERRHHAHRPRPAGPAAAAGHRRPLARARPLRSRRRRSTTPPTPRPTSRATTSAGSTCAASATTRYSIRRRARAGALRPALQDPGETQNVYKAYSQRPRASRVRPGGASSKAGGTQAPSGSSLDPETLQRLAALGYVGNVIDVDPNAVLPDPKDKLPLFAMMNAAKSARPGRGPCRATRVAKMREVIAERPEDHGRAPHARELAEAAPGPDGRRSAAFKQARSRLKPDDDIALGNLAAHADGAREQAGRARRARGLPHRAARRTRRTRSPGISWPRSTSIPAGSTEARDSFTRRSPRTRRWAARSTGSARSRSSAGTSTQAEDACVRQALALEPRLRTAQLQPRRASARRAGDGRRAEALYREELATYRGPRPRPRSTSPRSGARAATARGCLSRAQRLCAGRPTSSAPATSTSRARSSSAGRLDRRGRPGEARPRGAAALGHRPARPLRARGRPQPARRECHGRGGGREGPQAEAVLRKNPRRGSETWRLSARYSPLRPPVFRTSRMSEMVISLSAAFTMS